MLGIRRRDLARDSRKSNIQTKLTSDDREVNLKNSSLTSSSSSDSSDQECHPRISGFMKNVAPTVVTKYIKTNKMDSPFDNSHIHGNLNGKSIFQTALAIKTGKMEGMSSTDSVTSVTSSKRTVKTAKVETSSTKSNSSKGIAVQTNGATLLTKTLTSTRTATRAIRRHKRSSAKRNKRESSSDEINKDLTITKRISPLETLTPLQRRVLKVKKYAREHRPSVPEPACPSHAFREATKGGLKSPKIKEDVQGRLSHKTKSFASIYNKSVETSPAKCNKPHEVAKTSNTKEIKTNIPDSDTGTQPRKYKSSVEETHKDDNASEDVSNKASAQAFKNLILSPAKEVASKEPTNNAPFDETDEFHQEKVEVFVLPCNTNIHETIIIDSSRNLNDTVKFHTEEQEAAIRRMELVRRARSLIKNRTDPTPCADDAVRVNSM